MYIHVYMPVGTSNNSKNVLVGYNLLNPLQAGTSAIPSKHSIATNPNLCRKGPNGSKVVLGYVLPRSVLHGFAQRHLIS